jgi:hypothetical protein
MIVWSACASKECLAQDSAAFKASGMNVIKTNYTTRAKLVLGAHAVAYGTTITGLYMSWYKGHPFGKFSFVNDNRKWLQLDKLGHAWSGYIQGRNLIQAWRWAGMSDKKAIWTGGLTGFAFQNLVEILDGFSSAWGFSWGDYIADIAGSAMVMGQEMAWKEQRILFKFSAHRNQYAESSLSERANEIYGKSLASRLLDDYNAQTYWLSANLSSFLKKSGLPRWLNMAIGYGADGMFGETHNRWIDANGTEFDRSDRKRLRQFYISPDVDFSKIKTRSRFLRTAFFILNSVKFPAPAVEFSNGKTKFHWFYF